MFSKVKSILPSWVIWWFVASAIICIWDATFIMTRPHSLPGGSLHWIWYLYQYYINLDQRYMDLNDSFVFAQSLLNYIEVVLNIVTLIMNFRNSKHTVVTAFTVSTMTFWKTVLYLLMFTEFCTGGEYRHGNSFVAEIMLVWIPNGVWVVLPFAVMVALWGKFTAINNYDKNYNDNNNYSNSSYNNGHTTTVNGNGVGNGIKNGHSQFIHAKNK